MNKGVKWLILIAIGVVIVPVIINEAYKYGNGYITMWNAADMLSFYGAMLSFAGTVVLGFVATRQTQRANDLTNKMLELEKSRDFPIVDIVEILDDEQISSDMLRSALHLCLNESYFYINEDKSLEEGSYSVAVFKLVNICSNHIISLVIRDVAQSTTFRNGESVVTKIDEIEYNGGIRVLGCNESQYLVISGIDFEYPPSLTEKEIFEQGYINPVIKLEITLLLGNIKGKKYRETIRIDYLYIPSSDGINYPCIIGKEILSINEDETG